MKAVVFHSVGDIRLDDVPEPKLEDSTDAIVRLMPGNAPSQALEWGVQIAAKAGTLSVIGVYPPNDRFFPIGMAMNKNLTVNMGNCHHRRYIPELVTLVREGGADPLAILTKVAPMSSAIDAYRAFDQRQPGWMKVELAPAG